MGDHANYMPDETAESTLVEAKPGGIKDMRQTLAEMSQSACSVDGLSQVATIVQYTDLDVKTVGENFFVNIDDDSKTELSAQLQAAKLSDASGNFTAKGATAIGQCLVDEGKNQNAPDARYSKTDLCTKVVDMDVTQSFSRLGAGDPTYNERGSGGSLGCQLEWGRMQNPAAIQSSMSALKQTEKGGAALQRAFANTPSLQSRQFYAK